MKNLFKNIKELKTKDVIIALLILVLPFLFYLYKLAPNTAVWETELFTFNSGGWGNVYLYLWLTLTRLLLVFILSIWFITCKHWWRYVILVPLIIELFKFISVFNNNVSVIDEIEYIYSLPFTIPIIAFVLFISKKINYYSKYLDLNNEMNAEIESLLNELEINNDKNGIIEEFRQLKENKSSLSMEDYKNKLLQLRKHLTKL